MTAQEAIQELLKIRQYCTPRSLATVDYAIVAENAVIGAGATVGSPPPQDDPDADWGITVVAGGVKVGDRASVAAHSMVTRNVKAVKEGM